MLPQKNLRVLGVYGAALNLPLDKGDAGIDQTAAAMTAVIHSAAASPLVQMWARRVIPNGAKAARLFYVLQSAVEFTKDPAGVEMLRHPDQLVTEINERAANPDPAKRKAPADCDDLAMLGAAALLALGIDAYLVVMDPGSGRFEHVYFGAMIADMPVPLDPQETDAPFTQRAAVRRKAYPL